MMSSGVKAGWPFSLCSFFHPIAHRSTLLFDRKWIRPFPSSLFLDSLSLSLFLCSSSFLLKLAEDASQIAASATNGQLENDVCVALRSEEAAAVRDVWVEARKDLLPFRQRWGKGDDGGDLKQWSGWK